MLLVFHQIVYKDELKHRTIIFGVTSILLILLLNAALFNWLNSDEAWFAAGEQYILVVVLVVFAWRRHRINHPVGGSAGRLKNLSRNKPETTKWTSESFLRLQRYLKWKVAKLESKLESKKDEFKHLSLEQKNQRSEIKSQARDLRIQLAKSKIWTALKLVVLSIRKLVQVYPHNYYTFLVLIIILNSLFPVVFFYKIAHWQESLLWSKYEQLEAREAAIAREQMLNTNFEFLNKRPDLLPYTRFQGNYLPEPAKLKDTTTNWGDKFERLLFEAWPRLADPVGISSAAAFNKALDGKWAWRKSTEEVEITYNEKTRSGFKEVSYTSPLATFNPFGGSYGGWMFLLVILSLFLIYRVIRFCAKYIFGMGLIPEVRQPSLEDLKKRLAHPCHLYITGLPGSKTIRP